MYAVVSFFFFSCTFYRAARSACSRDNSCYLSPLVLLPFYYYYYLYIFVNLLFRCRFSTSEQIFSGAGVQEDLQHFDFSCAAGSFFSPPRWQLCIAQVPSSDQAYFSCTILSLARCVQVNNMEDFDLHGGAPY